MGYAFVPLVLSLGLGLWYVTLRHASYGSKLAVVVVVAVALTIWLRYPQLLWLATLLQVAICIYLLVYRNANRHLR
ncbi:MAG: hypothetical protein ACRD1B_09095 [Thermoanaerobaculia bacterium]